MRIRQFALASLLALIPLACGRGTIAPTAPATSIATNASPGGGEIASLKATVPIPVSPVNSTTIAEAQNIGPTLVATSAALKFSMGTPFYRFRVINPSGIVVQDSGQILTTTWTVPVLLTTNSTYTWVVRAEYQGLVGDWSAPATFKTPAPVNPYAGTISSNWRGCGDTNTKKITLVTCVWNAVHPVDSPGDLEVSKRVAWLLRAERAGLLLKGSGDGTVFWNGYNFSGARICYPDGNLWKIVTDTGPGGANLPAWNYNDTIDPTQCIPAMDPDKQINR